MQRLRRVEPREVARVVGDEDKIAVAGVAHDVPVFPAGLADMCDVLGVMAGLPDDGDQVETEAFAEISRHRNGVEPSAAAAHRLLIAPRVSALSAVQRVGGGINRRQPDHIRRQAGIGFDQFGRLGALRRKLGDEMHREPAAAEHRIAAENLRIADDKMAGPAQVARPPEKKCWVYSSWALGLDTEPAGGLGDRQKQRHGTAGEAEKSKMFIEAESDLILGVDNEREDGRLGPHGAGDRIDDQRAAKPASAKSLVDSEPADEACRKGRITRQPFGLLGRKFGEGKAGRGEGVVAGNFAGGVERDKAVADAAADILGRQLPEITVEGRHAAGKAGAVMVGAEWLEGEGSGHRDGVISRR